MFHSDPEDGRQNENGGKTSMNCISDQSEDEIPASQDWRSRWVKEHGKECSQYPFDYQELWYQFAYFGYHQVSRLSLLIWRKWQPKSCRNDGLIWEIHIWHPKYIQWAEINLKDEHLDPFSFFQKLEDNYEKIKVKVLAKEVISKEDIQELLVKPSIEYLIIWLSCTNLW